MSMKRHDLGPLYQSYRTRSFDEFLPVAIGNLQTYKSEKILENIIKTPIDLNGILLYPNVSVRWKTPDSVDIKSIIKGACQFCCARDAIKYMRRNLADSVIKGGSKKVGIFPNELNKQAELLREEYGRAPCIFEIQQAMTKNLKRLVDFDDKKATKFNGKYLKMARGMFENMRIANPSTMIYGRSEVRDGLNNLEINKYLEFILEKYPGATMIPPYLCLPELWKQFEDAIIAGPKPGKGSGKIIWVLNTSDESPGVHWQAACVDLIKKQCHLYCSCNFKISHSTYEPFRKLADKYSMPLWMPFVCSQKGSADCGVFSCMYCILFLEDNHISIDSVPMPDHNLCRMRNEIERLYKK